MKKCSICDEIKPIEEFWKWSRGVEGRRAQCKPCAYKIAQKSRAKDSDKWKRYDRLKHVERTYGLSPEEYVALERKFPVCPICGGENNRNVDHNHDTGEVRGLLCEKCNIAIGLLKDNPDYILNAFSYIINSIQKVLD